MRGQKDYQISPQCIPSDQQMPFEYVKDIQSSLLGKTVVVYNIIRMIAQICIHFRIRCNGVVSNTCNIEFNQHRLAEFSRPLFTFRATSSTAPSFLNRYHVNRWKNVQIILQLQPCGMISAQMIHL